MLISSLDKSRDVGLLHIYTNINVLTTKRKHNYNRLNKNI